jgi:wyosine [tRNA(Phe)-imidazoG37] synthetase (radical SAM superfamily)
MSSNAIVNGPEMSRRFGRVIRINLVNAPEAACNFACAYCRSAESTPTSRTTWWREDDVLSAVAAAVQDHPDAECLAISGNGEPTLHPAFAVIVEGLLRIRATHAPAMKLAVVSNGSTLDRIEVRHALSQLDVRLMKLDAGDATTFRVINGAVLPLGRLIAGLRYLGDVDLLTRFVRNGERTVDNTSPAALDAWLGVVREIGPRTVQICGHDWPSGRAALADVADGELESIAARVREMGIPARVYPAPTVLG